MAKVYPYMFNGKVSQYFFSQEKGLIFVKVRNSVLSEH